MNSCVRMRTERLGMRLIGAKEYDFETDCFWLMDIVFDCRIIRIRRLPDSLWYDEGFLANPRMF